MVALYDHKVLMDYADDGTLRLSLLRESEKREIKMWHAITPKLDLESI